MRPYRSFVANNDRWRGFDLRSDDIIITTASKCGTTWLQTICALLLFGRPPFPAPLADLSPWLEMNVEPVEDVHARLAAQTHRRFIKSHTPLDGLPTAPGVRYLTAGRDPRDVALSWDGHMQNIDIPRLLEVRVASVGADDPEAELIKSPPSPPPQEPAERFLQFVESEDEAIQGGSLLGLAIHLNQAWAARGREDVLLVHYADLRADLDREMRKIAAFLGIPVDAAAWPALVDAATFDAMKSRADDLAPATHVGLWQNNARFFAEGRLGGWRALPREVLARYEERANELFEPELKQWLEGGGAYVPTASRTRS